MLVNELVGLLVKGSVNPNPSKYIAVCPCIWFYFPKFQFTATELSAVCIYTMEMNRTLFYASQCNEKKHEIILHQFVLSQNT